jgi:hypothetical protein
MGGYLRDRRVVALVLAALMAAALGACGDDDDEATATTTTTEAAPEGSPTVQVEYIDHGYRVSGPLVAGGTLELRNTGQEFHMMALGRFKPGKTLDDLREALSRSGPPGGGGPEEGDGQQGPTTTATGSAPGEYAQAQEEGGQEGGGQEEDPTADVLDEVGLPGNFISPGQAAEVTVPDLGPGTYGLLCFIPTEGEGVPHFAKGMVGELVVTEGDAPEPSADVTYRATPGRAVDGPATLSAGRHTIRFEASGPGSEELEPGIARLNPGTTISELDQYFSRLFESEDPPPKGAGGRAPGQILFSAFDFGPTKSFFLTVDLTPGNYAVIAEDTDKEDRPRPPREMINVRVT